MSFKSPTKTSAQRLRQNSFVWQDVGFFEGAEKLLEVWFRLPDDPPQGRECAADGKAGLRQITRGQWEALLDKVNCKIISCQSNEVMDAYLLSESSMYVSQDRFILKTCGVTTLLLAVPMLMQLVDTVCGVSQIQDFFYSRKNFKKPELQEKLHQNFEHEVSYLDRIFPNGAAYCLGRLNASRWYLYMLDQPLPKDCDDQTLEILMTDLDESAMAHFTKDGGNTAADATKNSGILDLLRDAIIDDALFDPCGYSMNALLGDCYFTIHITPQPDCSYVSFETNVRMDSYSDLIGRVIKCFHPQQFTITLFTNHLSPCGSSLNAFDERHVSGYRRVDKQFCEFSNAYNLTMCHYSQSVSTPLSPVLQSSDSPFVS